MGTSNLCRDFYKFPTQDRNLHQKSIKITTWFEQLNSIYGELKIGPFESVFRQTWESGKTIHTLSQLLTRRFRAGEQSRPIYEKFGFRFAHRIVNRPSSYQELMTSVTLAIIEVAKAKGLSESDLILPAIVFVRGQLYDSNSIMLVRPGIDPIPRPEDGWRVDERAIQIPNDIFSENLAQGKFSLGQDVYFHDIGHFIDFVSDPMFMASVRRYFNDRQKTAIGYDDILNSTENYLLERNHHPKMGMLQAFDSAMGPPAVQLNRKSYREKYRKFSETELYAQRAKIAKNYYVFFNHFGGAARDASTELHLDTRPRILNVIEGLMGKPLEEIRLGNNFGGGHARLMDEIPGLFDRMFVIENFLKTGHFKEKSIEFLEQNLTGLNYHGDPAQLRSHLLQLLRNTLAEIEFRYRLSNYLNLNPSRVAQDLSTLMTSAESYKKTSTYRYYLQTSQLGEKTWEAFVEIADRFR